MAYLETAVTTQTRTRGFLFFFVAGLVLAASAQGLVYLLLLDHTLGLWLPTSPVPVKAASSVTKVAILQDSGFVLPGSKASYEARVREWTQAFTQKGLPFELVHAAGMEAVMEDVNVLAIPSAVCLSDEQLNLITRFIARGNGILSSGAIGTRDEKCNWRGWGFFQKVIGEPGRSISVSEQTYVTFAGESFFSGSVPTGYRLSLRAQDLTLTNAKSADARWTNWRLQALPEDLGQETTAAIHRNTLGGRVVWFGFAEDSILDENARAVFANYLSASVQWTGRELLITKANWPEARPTAAMFIQNVSKQASTAKFTADFLTSSHVPVTNLLQAETATQISDGIAGDVALLAPLSMDSSYRAVEEPLLKLRKQLFQNISQSVVRGVAPRWSTLDNRLLPELNQFGYTYFLDELTFDRAEPEIIEYPVSPFFPLQRSELLRLPISTPKDLQIIAGLDDVNLNPAMVGRRFVQGLDEVTELGGLFAFYFHDYLLGSPDYGDALVAVLDEVKQRPVWVASADQISDWWSTRHKLQVDAHAVGEWRLELDVTNLAERDMKNPVIRLHLPYNASEAKLVPTFAKLRLPVVEFEDPDTLLIRFSSLPSQSHSRFTITLSNPEK